MRTETREWFAKVMREQRHALELIDSDILYINPILAEHYGIYGVTGTEFREVPVPRDSHRGGLLTQAAFLTGNSNGVDSHPIKRGVWLLDRILNDPPPPPPPNVPELDTKAPEFKGKTLTEQLAIHRDVQACRNCHQQIDPFGLPFESFNTVGQWRNSEDTQPPCPMESPSTTSINSRNIWSLIGKMILRKHWPENSSHGDSDARSVSPMKER